jgi:ADP-ribose pyrophosphatase YjhB (NUDIX family)
MKSKANISKDSRPGINYIGVTVNFLIHDGNGKILLQQRSKNCRDEQGKWDIGGGAVEFGETLEAAMKRELFEEYMTKPIEYAPTKVGTALRIHEGIPTHWVYVNFKVLVDPKKIKIGEPHKVDQIGWFGKDNLPQPQHSMFNEALRIALDHNLLQ